MNALDQLNPGFIDQCVWAPTLAKMPPDKAKAWLEQWDPRHYLKDAATPMLWVTGTNDFAYPMDSLQKSYFLPPTPRTSTFWPPSRNAGARSTTVVSQP